jgi:hypothetical protein
MRSAAPMRGPAAFGRARDSSLSLSPLDTLGRAFTLLTTGPDPLALDGRELPGLPDQMITLNRLKRVLLAPATRQATRDAAWRALVLAARDGQPAWVVGALPRQRYVPSPALKDPGPSHPPTLRAWHQARAQDRLSATIEAAKNAPARGRHARPTDED